MINWNSGLYKILSPYQQQKPHGDRACADSRWKLFWIYKSSNLEPCSGLPPKMGTDISVVEAFSPMSVEEVIYGLL